MQGLNPQLKDQIVSGLDFDVGFLQNSNLVVNLQSPEDLREVWSELLKETGKKWVLWCDGLKEEPSGGRKRRCDVKDASDDEELGKAKKIKKRWSKRW